VDIVWLVVVELEVVVEDVLVEVEVVVDVD